MRVWKLPLNAGKSPPGGSLPFTTTISRKWCYNDPYQTLVMGLVFRERSSARFCR